MEKNFNTMGKAVKQAVRSKSIEDLASMAQQFGSLLPKLMIRRQIEGKWFGERMVILPPNEHRDVQCGFDPAFEKAFKELEAQVARKYEEDYRKQVAEWERRPKGPKPKPNRHSFFAVSRRNRLIATFPGLIRLQELYPSLEMIGSELLKERWLHNPESSPYYKHLDMLVNSSTKILEVRKIMQSLHTDYLGHPEKLLVMSAFLIATFILMLVCCTFNLLNYSSSVHPFNDKHD